MLCRVGREADRAFKFTMTTNLSVSQESTLYMSSHRSDLTSLAERYGSDKGDSDHQYTRLYDMLFAPRRDDELNLLEFGLQNHGPEIPGISSDRELTSIASIDMWLDYFPRANVYGFDICDFSDFKRDRFRFIQGDQGKLEDIQGVLEACDSYDIIIDDASHASYHQQLAFVTLFPHLRAGGLYIIEDLQWQGKVYEKGCRTSHKTRDLFAKFIKTGEFPKKTHPIERERFQALAKDINIVLMPNDNFNHWGKAKLAIIHKLA